MDEKKLWSGFQGKLNALDGDLHRDGWTVYGKVQPAEKSLDTVLEEANGIHERLQAWN